MHGERTRLSEHYIRMTLTSMLQNLSQSTLLLTMFGQVFLDAPSGSWSGRGSGASTILISCDSPHKN